MAVYVQMQTLVPGKDEVQSQLVGVMSIHFTKVFVTIVKP